MTKKHEIAFQYHIATKTIKFLTSTAATEKQIALQMKRKEKDKLIKLTEINRQQYK